jgi:hypothetical protein
MSPDDIRARREARGMRDPLNRWRARLAKDLASGKVTPIVEKRAEGEP